jgi:hypothetical protein
MNVEIGTEEAQFPEKENINGYRLKVREIVSKTNLLTIPPLSRRSPVPENPPPPPHNHWETLLHAVKRVGPIGNTFCQVGPRGNQGIYRGVTSETKGGGGREC